MTEMTSTSLVVNTSMNVLAIDEDSTYIKSELADETANEPESDAGATETMYDDNTDNTELFDENET